jgi:OOP family OmpA-OmpF porin
LKIVKDAAAAIKKRGYVTVIGHTDTTGTDDYNMRLSDRRAAAVRDALIAQGVYAKMIKLKAMGEKDLAVPTADGVREPKNRRAQILIE